MANALRPGRATAPSRSGISSRRAYRKRSRSRLVELLVPRTAKLRWRGRADREAGRMRSDPNVLPRSSILDARSDPCSGSSGRRTSVCSLSDFERLNRAARLGNYPRARAGVASHTRARSRRTVSIDGGARRMRALTLVEVIATDPRSAHFVFQLPGGWQPAHLVPRAPRCGSV
jgi:hypothetical protein